MPKTSKCQCGHRKTEHNNSVLTYVKNRKSEFDNSCKYCECQKFVPKEESI